MSDIGMSSSSKFDKELQPKLLSHANASGARSDDIQL